MPQSKAHPHCLCSLTPTTRKMRKDGVRGPADFPAFIDQLNAAQRWDIIPALAREAHAKGTPWAELLDGEGRWLRH